MLSLCFNVFFQKRRVLECHENVNEARELTCMNDMTFGMKIIEGLQENP